MSLIAFISTLAAFKPFNRGGDLFSLPGAAERCFYAGPLTSRSASNFFILYNTHTYLTGRLKAEWRLVCPPSPPPLTGFLHVSGREDGVSEPVSLCAEVPCVSSDVMQQSKAYIKSQGNDMLVLFFQKRAKRRVRDQLSCKVFEPTVYTRTAARRARVSAPRGSLFRSGVGIPRVSVVLAPRCSFVTLRAVTMFPAPLATSAAGPCRCWRRAFFFFLFTPQQCSKQTAAANTISTLSQWSCHGSHCSYLCSGFSEVPVIDTEFRYSLRLCRQKSHTPLQLWDRQQQTRVYRERKKKHVRDGDWRCVVNSM